MRFALWFAAHCAGGTAAVVAGFLLLNIDDRWLWAKIKSLFCCSSAGYSRLPLDPLDPTDKQHEPSYDARDFSLNAA